MSTTFDQALWHLQSGRFREAEAIFRDILKADPKNWNVLHLLGVAMFQAGRGGEAAGIIERSLQQNPGNADALNNLGQVYEFLDRLDDAIDAYRKAVTAVPDFTPALANLGTALLQKGEAAEAVDCLIGALEAFADDPDVLGGLGKALAAMGRHDEAVIHLRRAREIVPEDPAVLCNLGTALQKGNKLDEAIAVFEQALTIDPNSMEAHNNLGILRQNKGELSEAVSSFERAIAINPNFVEAYTNLGFAQLKQGEMNEAISSLERALAINPNSMEALNNLGSALRKGGNPDEAAKLIERAISINPNVANSYGLLASTFKDLGKIEDALDAYSKVLEIEPDYVKMHSNYLFCAQYQIGISAAKLKEIHTEWDKRHGLPLRSTWSEHGNPRDPGKTLRIGLVSPDLGRHPIGYFVLNLLEHHDPEDMEFVCYSDHLHDDLTKQLQEASDGWLDTHEISDEDLSKRIQSDGIDVLIDLAGHTGNGRLLVFARKPAPVQVGWGGYVGTTGLSAMDYLLADQYLIPEGEDQFYLEKIVRLPDDTICYSPPSYAPTVGPLPADRNGFVTFGCFNNVAKINSEVLAAWAQILSAVEGSQLVLKYRAIDAIENQERYLSVFAAHGIEPQRFVFEGKSPHEELLARYNEIDIALDTFPYSGGLTTCESLWMGVPVITLPGQTYAGRTTLAHLSTVGLDEWAAKDVDHYVELAVKLANDHSHLTDVRMELRERMSRSPLCDGPRFANNFTAAMKQIWRDWCSPQDD